MWSLQHQLLFLSTAVICVTSAQEIQVFGYEGKHVKVSCSYEQGYEDYEKYLCNKACDWGDVLITTVQTNKTKYSIYDDKKSRIFTTTISDLRSIDAGVHWCGVSKNGKDIYTEVDLKIRPDTCCDRVVEIQSYQEGSVSIDCPYESIQSNNRKYMCRGKQPSVCLQQALITSESSQNTRFNLTDGKTSMKFTVRISNLTLEDSGLYLCGVHTNTGFDVFSAVELRVKEWCCVKTKTMQGTMGHSLTFDCPYPPQHHGNKKLLCKGNQRRGCAHVKSMRFTLQTGSSNSFQVTISKLEVGDAGTYWCGSDPQWNAANYTKIELSVVSVAQTTTVATGKFTTPHLNTTESSQQLTEGHKIVSYVVYIVPSVLLALLILVPILIITVCKRKCHKDKEAEVFANRNKAVEDHMQEVTDAEDLYTNHDAVMKSKKASSIHQNVCYPNDSADEEQPDYENFTITEELYSNEFYHRSNKR